LNDQLLSEFAETFYRYGNNRGRYWFIGMEEGGGNSVEEIDQRLEAWVQGGKRELEDVAEFHERIGVPELFTGKAKLQTTWNKLIRIVLSHQGVTPTTDDVRAYQRDKLGRLESETCLLELLPLPSPSTSQWLYGSHSSLPHLATRKSYHDYYTPKRVEHLQAMIKRHQPLCVIFYGLNYMKWWKAIADIDFTKTTFGKHAYWKGKNGQASFFVVAHPAATGITNDYFHEIGRVLKEIE
jgi:hypothetical protein